MQFAVVQIGMKLLKPQHNYNIKVMFRSANIFSRVCSRLKTKKTRGEIIDCFTPALQNVPYGVFLHLSRVFSGCFLGVFRVFPGCSPGVSWVFPYGVFLHGLIMARFCQNVRSLFCQLEICIQSVPLIWATLYGLGCLIEFETPCKYVVGMYVVVATFS